MKSGYRFQLALYGLLALTGCGGGGGESNPPATPIPKTCTAWPDAYFLPDDMHDSLITDLIVVDACTLILSGHQNTATPLSPQGDADGFILRLRIDETGQIKEEWRYLLRTGRTDSVSHLDALGTEVRFLGWTEGVLAGQTGFGKSDLVIGSLTYNGTQLTLSQLGNERPNRPLGLFANGGDSYLMVGNDETYIPTNYVESYEDPWIASVNQQAGAYHLDWLLREGTAQGDFYQTVLATPDATSLLLAKVDTRDGPTVQKRDLYGNLLWNTRMSPSPYDYIASLATASADTLLVYGSSYLDLGGGLAGGADLFVAQLGAQNGDLLWLTQFGTTDIDWAAALVIHNGQLYAISEVFPQNLGAWQVKLSRLSATGELISEEVVHTASGGAVMTSKAIGTQLVVAGATVSNLGDTRGWLKFISLTP